jgi:hypothetical protein
MVKPQGFRIRLIGHVRSLIKGIVGGVKTPSRTPPPPRPPPDGEAPWMLSGMLSW